MSEAATLADIKAMVAEQFGPEPEYHVHLAVHADGEAYSVNVMKGAQVALRTHAEESREALAMMAATLNRLWALNMTRSFGHCSQ